MTAKTDPKPRPYPKILRTTVEADRDLRVYAAEYEIEPYEALVVAIDRLRDPVESESLRASLCHVSELAERQQAEIERLTAAYEAAQATARAASKDADETERERDAECKVSAALRADLESAREATRRADTEVERLKAWRVDALADAERKTATIAHLDAEFAAARTIAPQPCACALPDDLAPRLATIAARRGVEPDVILPNVRKNGSSNNEAADKYQDAQKAARARS